MDYLQTIAKHHRPYSNVFRIQNENSILNFALTYLSFFLNYCTLFAKKGPNKLANFVCGVLLVVSTLLPEIAILFIISAVTDSANNKHYHNMYQVFCG